MSEQEYDPKAFALELGFSEEDAELFRGVNANATNLRNLAKTREAKGKMPNQKGQTPDERLGDGVAKTVDKKIADLAKSHKHFYRKDGTCKCGVVKGESAAERKVREQALEDAEEKTNNEIAASLARAEAAKETSNEEAIAKAAAEVEAKAADRPTYAGEGQNIPDDKSS